MTLDTLLGYMALVGLLMIPMFALLNGYFLLTAPPATDNPLLDPTGPFIGGIEPPSPGAVIVSEEYRTTSTLLWGTVALTAAAIISRILLHMQDNQSPNNEE